MGVDTTTTRQLSGRLWEPVRGRQLRPMVTILRQRETDKQRIERIRAWIAIQEDVKAAIDRDLAAERRERYKGRHVNAAMPTAVRRARESVHARMLELRKQLCEVE